MISPLDGAGKGFVTASAYDSCVTKVYGKVFAQVRPPTLPAGLQAQIRSFDSLRFDVAISRASTGLCEDSLLAALLVPSHCVLCVAAYACEYVPLGVVVSFMACVLNLKFCC